MSRSAREASAGPRRGAVAGVRPPESVLVAQAEDRELLKMSGSQKMRNICHGCLRKQSQCLRFNLRKGADHYILRLKT